MSSDNTLMAEDNQRFQDLNDAKNLNSLNKAEILRKKLDYLSRMMMKQKSFREKNEIVIQMKGSPTKRSPLLLTKEQSTLLETDAMYVSPKKSNPVNEKLQDLLATIQQTVEMDRPRERIQS